MNLKWAILTTGHLPEAYVMARFLLERGQEVALFSIRGRTRAQRRAVLKRLARRRGWLYVADLLAGRLFRGRYLDARVPIFPEITPQAMADVRQRALTCDIDDPHDADSIQRIRAFAPDYLLLLGAPVLRAAVFSLPARATLNWHHGLSPGYRGSDCVIRAMARNEFDRIGFTIHEVSEVVDGGSVLLQRSVTVRPDLGFTEAVADVARQGLAGFIEVVDGILAGHPPAPRPQPGGGAHFPPAGFRTFRRAYLNFQQYARN